jgi:hypothetical protein
MGAPEVLEPPKSKLSDLTKAERVKLYVAIRDKLAIERKAWETREGDLKEKMAKIGATLLQEFAAEGVESTRTEFGTAFKDTVGYASVGDPDVFFEFIFEKEAREFLEARVNKTAVKAYIAEHGDLPPGVNWREEVTIKVRRA